MAKFKYQGLDVFQDTITKLGDKFEETAGKAVYNGASVLADAVKANIETIPEERGNAYATEGKKADGLLPSQKAGLIDGFGISRIRDDAGNINVKIGFDGYNRTKTKRYPNGQPNAMIARSLESGTSFRRKNAFISKAQKAVSKTAEEKMKSVFEEEITKINK